MEANVRIGELSICVDCGETCNDHALDGDGLPLCKRCASQNDSVNPSVPDKAADKVSKKCQFERKESKAEAQAACDAFIAKYKGGALKEIGTSCLEVVEDGYVLLMVYFKPEGKSNGVTRNNLSGNGDYSQPAQSRDFRDRPRLASPRASKLQAELWSLSMTLPQQGQLKILSERGITCLCPQRQQSWVV